MAKGIVLYPKRKERGLTKVAGDEVNSVINQITNTTIQQISQTPNMANLDNINDGTTYKRLKGTQITDNELSTLLRNLAMGGYKLTGLGAGSASGNSVRYEQLIGLYLLLTGGTMSGAIAMGSQKITGLAAGTTTGDAVRYEQQDKIIVFSVAGTLTAVANASFEITAPIALTIQKVYINVKTAPTGATLIVDVNKEGTTIFTTQANRPTIVANETEAESGTPDVTALAQNDILSIDIDQIGSTIAGSSLLVEIRCKVA